MQLANLITGWMGNGLDLRVGGINTVMTSGVGESIVSPPMPALHQFSIDYFKRISSVICDAYKAVEGQCPVEAGEYRIVVDYDVPESWEPSGLPDPPYHRFLKS